MGNINETCSVYVEKDKVSLLYRSSDTEWLYECHIIEGMFMFCKEEITDEILNSFKHLCKSPIDEFSNLLIDLYLLSKQCRQIN